eukprot:CAMPEP_0185849148 /NCGR_PEP_ID=MMETSP1354-20130828/3753_1 /TAXON_ID=708628 /ORGANISM="Erythrolobus madagascarensis, Strain CCMP3276" /LENGTH=365 /DNA_ID=CAMNT_0028549629 /DNA_START=377 /DNA_END=1474 /DNA_ORIENTATION=+
MCYAQTHYAEWTLRHAQLIITYTILQLIPLAYYVVILTTSGSSCLTDHDLLLYTDSLLALITGLSLYAFPKWLFHACLIPVQVASPSGINLHLARVLGSLLIGSSFSSYFTIYAPSHSPKYRIFLARVAQTASLSFLSIVFRMFNGLFSPSTRAGAVSSTSLLPREVISMVPTSVFLCGLVFLMIWCGVGVVGMRVVKRHSAMREHEVAMMMNSNDDDNIDFAEVPDRHESRPSSAAAPIGGGAVYVEDEFLYGQSRVGIFAPSPSSSAAAVGLSTAPGGGRAVGGAEMERPTAVKSTNPFDVATDMSAAQRRRANQQHMEPHDGYENTRDVHVMVSPADAGVAGGASGAHKRTAKGSARDAGWI